MSVRAGYFLISMPAGAVGQVPVEAVEFVAGQEVQLPLDELLVAEVARDVEHEAPVAEARSVLDHNGRNWRPQCSASWPSD